MTDDLKRVADRMEALRKKLTVAGKQANGVEAQYAEAYAQLCRLDPARYRPNRGKRR